jgi:hypothetical protein
MSLTCGYTRGDGNLPATCTSPNACQYFVSTDGNNFGCCPPSVVSTNGICYMSACYDWRAGGLATSVVVLGGAGGAGFYW